MNLILIKPRGFCLGVKRAIDIVERALCQYGKPVYVKHEIVHNRHVIENLKSKGVIFVEDLKGVPKGSKIIYSAHGITPEVREEAQALGLVEIDATCPLVFKLHSAIKRFAKKGFKIILIGKKNHEEIIGAVAEAPLSTFVVEHLEDIEKLKFSHQDKLCYMAQTTFNLFDIKKYEECLKQKYPNIEPFSSICYATTNRQEALHSILDKVDAVIVVGDKKSSNSNRLHEIALKKKSSFLIGSPEEIDEKLLAFSTVAMTAGASTPESVVEKCISKLKGFGYSVNEEVVFDEKNSFGD